MVRCGEDDGLPLRRPISIHQLDGDNLALLFNTVGKGTCWLSQRKKGEAIDLLGPLGNGFSINPESHNLLLVAGGMGIAPLAYLANMALQQMKKVTLLVGAKYGVQLLPEKFLPKGVTIITATEDGEQGYEGCVSELLPDYADSADQVFACGPTAMYREMAQRKETLGLKGKPIQVSLEMRMGCGLGVCYACTVRTRNGLKQVCKDGPVFELDDIVWDELIFNC
jgi:dihydroorotate dehydrogenase electron transfer subunit